jgi:hypothetical protein
MHRQEKRFLFSDPQKADFYFFEICIDINDHFIGFQFFKSSVSMIFL